MYLRFVAAFFSLVLAAVTFGQTAAKFSIPASSVTASTYDTANNAVPANAVDGSLTTRWAGQGDGAYITFDLGATKYPQYINIAWHQGDTRTETFDVLCATSSSGPWTTLLSRVVSSGLTTALETYDFGDTSARYVRVVGHGNSSGNGWNSITEVEVWGLASAPGIVSAPTFSPAPGTYASAQNVSISTATPGAAIRYTTDNTIPTSTNGTLYTGPISIAQVTTLKAIAYASGMIDSAVTSGTYNINLNGTPSKFPVSGSAVTASTYDTSNNCVPSNAVDGNLSTRWSGQGDGAYITFDLGGVQNVQYMKIAWYQGNTRAETFDVLASTASSGPWTTLLNRKVSSGTTSSLESYDFTDTNARYIRVVGHGNSSGNGWNSIAEAELWGLPGAVPQAAAPTFSPGPGTYTSAQNVTLSTTSGGASIRYTTNGSTPTSTNGTLYTGPIAVGATTTLKAVAYGTGYTDSPVTSGTYTINLPQVATPTFSPAPGSYSTAQNVSIATATSGATIRYTTDGSTPTTTAGTVYTGAVAINATTTLKAVAYASGMTTSAVASGTYTITSGTGGLNPDLPPSGNFDLSHWKLTIPSGVDISTADLNNGYELANAFYTDSVSGGMVFRCPNIAGTTSNSSYSRTELREMLNPGASASDPSNNWYTSTSSSTTKAAAGGVDGTLRATLRVDRVSTTGDSAKIGRVVIGQIHGPSSEPIRLYYHKRPTDARGAIYYGHDTPSNSNTYYPIIGDPNNLNPANGILLGEVFSYEIKVVGHQMTVTITRETGTPTTVTFTLETGYDNQYLYFKAGVYNQNNTGDSSDYVQATFFRVTHTHP